MAGTAAIGRVDSQVSELAAEERLFEVHRTRFVPVKSIL
jgi:hypothetical protein